MRFAGRVFKAGRHWAVEVPILGVVTQGKSRKDAFVMIADAIDALANRKGFHIEVFPGAGEYFEVGSPDVAKLTALLLRRQRVRRGLTLAEAAQKLGARSLNSYARYEQGRSVPSIERLNELLAAVTGEEFVLAESRGRRVA